MTDERKWKITGAIAKKFVAPSGKVAKLTIETSIDGRRGKDEVISFDKTVVMQVDSAGVGEFVTCEGRLSITKLTNRKGETIEDGDYDIWIPQLVMTSIQGATDGDGFSAKATVHQPSRREQVPRDPLPNDDDIPF